MKNIWRPIIVVLALLVVSTDPAMALPPKPMLRLGTDMHFGTVNRVSVDAAGRYVLTCSADKTAKLWDAGDGTLLKTLRVPSDEGRDGKLYACSLTADGKTAALGGWTGYQKKDGHNIYIFNVATGEMVQRITGMKNVVNNLKFHSNTTLAAVLGGKNGLRVFKKFEGRFVLYQKDTAYDKRSTSLAFDRSGRLATVSYDGYIRLYDNRAHLVKKKKLSSGQRPLSVAFSHDGRKLAVGFTDSGNVTVLDGASLDLLYHPDIQGATRKNRWFQVLTFSPNGYLFGGGFYQKEVNGEWWRFVRRWDREGAGPFINFKAVDNTVLDMTSMADGSILVVGGQPDVGRFTSKGDPIFYNRGETLDFLNRDRFDRFTVNPDGSVISFKSMHSKPLTFSVQYRQLSPSDIRFEKYRDVHGSVAVKDWYNSTAPKVNQKETGFLKRFEKSRSVDIANDGTVVVGADWYVYALDSSGKRKWSTPGQGAAWSVNIAGDDRTAVVAHGDGVIRWYRMADGVVLLALYVHPDGRRWILSTLDGYYDASPGADTLLGWHINNGRDQAPDFFPVGKFAAKYYRPDVVAQVLSYLDVSKALAAADRESKKKVVTQDLKQMLPPVVKILSPADSTIASASPVTVRYKVRTPSGEKVTGVKVFVDGRPLGARGIAVIGTGGDASEITVPIPRKDCTVSIVAENRYAASEPATIRLRWKGAETFVVKPKLYVLAIGVSNYKDKSLSLAYAAKDAKDFAEIMKQQKGHLYRDVSVKVLADREATKDNILDALDWILRQTTQKDIAMVFLAGHGVNDDYGRYYYMPHNTNTDKLRRTGVPYNDIKETVSNIAGKALFFIDTCHSGNILGGRRRGASDTTGIINELSSAENGVVVFASSTGRQYSLEDPKWGNGAFTKALVEGFSGKAAYKGSKITVNMLDLYISERVKELTKGRQTPTTAKPNTIPDFPIAVRQ